MRGAEQSRRLPVGAEVARGGGVFFRVWAPKRARVEVVLEGGPGAEGGSKTVELSKSADGYFEALAPGAGEGTLYRYRLDGRDGPFPDPASRYQPDGPHGPSRVVDPARFEWKDSGWKGASIEGQVVYEMHIGTFTREGTYAAAARELSALKETGITLIELMPVAEFPGRFGWGYDGVDLFAPTRLYGEPDDLRRFVAEAHAQGIAVILDVVYNHLGPDGNYLAQYSGAYFTDRYKNEWGEAINFDGEGAGPVREFFIANAAYWIDEFHMDGLRIDATQCIFDSSPEHVIAAMARRAREAAGGRSIVLIAENECQHAKHVRPPSRGGYGLDALWNDDFHHSAMAAMTGRNEAYYTDTKGSPQELISAAKWGYLFQGQRYAWQKKRRGTPGLDLSPAVFVNYMQNHDQVANSGNGLRCHALTSPGRFRAMTALLLLAPGTPMLFQGQEFAASSPFLFFADHNPDLAKLVKKGRHEFLAQFPSLTSKEAQASLDDPSALETFERCRLDLSERERNAWAVALHKDLLRLRREDPAFRSQRPRGVDGAVLGPEALVLRFFGEGEGEGGGEGGNDRLFLMNLGLDLALTVAPEPLLAPPEGTRWKLLWSSESARYGGSGTPPIETEDEGFRLPGHAAFVMAPETIDESTTTTITERGKA
jgi:maltooligosyltrehalose trehalohydrolase